MTEGEQRKRAQIVSDYGYGVVRQQACVRLWLAMVCTTALTVGALSLRFFQNVQRPRLPPWEWASRILPLQKCVSDAR